MKEFIVSARKYRPMTFGTVVGQQALTTTLKNAVCSGKLAHAYLFCGPRGVGKTTCARIFAKAINCTNPQDGGDACGECESCKSFNEQRSLNIHELDAASNNSVEDIRELISQVQIPPQLGRYKVFIIDEIHMLSTAAFNAFLKTLEEPPSYVIFILATTEKHKILPTILSRCQVFDFVRMNTNDTINHLMQVAKSEGYTAEEEALNLIAQKADGGMRDALSIFDQMVSFTNGQITYEAVCKHLNVLQVEYYFSMTNYILNRDITQCMLLLNQIIQKGFDPGIFIAGMASHMRDLMMSKDEATVQLMEKSEQIKRQYKEQATKCQARFLYHAIKLCNDCDIAYRTSRNKRLQVELCLIQLGQLTEEDVPSSGLRPTQIIKPLFKKPEEVGSTTPASAQTTTTQNGSNTLKETNNSLQPGTPSTPPGKERLAQTTSKLKTTFGPSIRKIKTNTSAEETQSQSTEGNATVEDCKPIEEQELQQRWLEYIQELPRESQAIAQRMRAMRPKLSEEKEYEVRVLVNNALVKQELIGLFPTLLPFLKRKLMNNYITLEIDIEEQQKVAVKYTKGELLNRMYKENHALKDLIENLALAFD